MAMMHHDDQLSLIYINRLETIYFKLKDYKNTNDSKIVENVKY